MLLFSGSATAFAFWYQNATVTEEADVVVGSGGVATLNVIMDNSDDCLVPSGQIIYSTPCATGDNVEEIIFSIDVLWTDTAELTLEGQLDVLVDNIVGDANDLLNFSYDTTYAITKGNLLTVTITVTMDMPANQTEYNDIANANITFDVTFTVNPN